MYGAMEPNLLHNIIVVDVFFFFLLKFLPNHLGWNLSNVQAFDADD